VAGLLDGLFSGGGNGLLDFLRANAMNQQMAGGLQSDQAQYGAPAMAQMPLGQPSPLDNAQWPQGPIGAPSQANAQMPQQAAPQSQTMLPQQGQGFGGFLQGLNENFQNMGNGGSLIGALTGQQPNNQTAQFLVSKGIDPAMARTIVSEPSLLRSVLPSLIGTGGQTDDIKEYQFAKRENPSLTFEKFMQQKRATSGEYSLTPQYGTNAKGETVLLQTGKSGTAIETVLPPGVKVSAGIEKIDLGTEWALINKRDGTLVGKQAKDVVGKESAEERGKVQGQAQAALPAAEMTAQRAIDKIDQFMGSKGFNDVFGTIDQFRPNWTMSGDGKEALARFKQLQGTAFLEGRTLLKGGGAITDFESNKAESAIARLERSLNEADAKEALNDFKDAIRAGAAKLKATAGGAAPSSPQPSGGLPSGWSVKVR
jgi:hypothetical protein